jgi:hypothetical protein
VATGPEAGNCGNMVDDDCDGLIDCSDPNCGPTKCIGGTENGQECASDQGSAACADGGGMCQCPTIKKDPTTIRFGRPGLTLDRFQSHGRLVLPAGVDVMASDVGFLLSNLNGSIYQVVLPAGSLTSNSNGTSFRYGDLKARTRGGLRKVRIRATRGTFRYWVEAYGDMSRAVDSNMAIQVYLANQPTSAIHAESWLRTRYGWKAVGFEALPNPGP